MVPEICVKQVPQTICETVCEQRVCVPQTICEMQTIQCVRKVPYTVCRQVPVCKTICCPVTVTRQVSETKTICVPRTICKQVPVEVCVKVPVFVPCVLPTPQCDRALRRRAWWRRRSATSPARRSRPATPATRGIRCSGRLFHRY